MMGEKLYIRASERLESLKKYYLENNDQSFCMRLTHSYALLDLIVRTFDDVRAKPMLADDLGAYLKFTGLTTLFLDTLEGCGPQKPEERCIKAKNCTCLGCTKACDMCPPYKLISLVEAYRDEMLQGRDEGHAIMAKVHATD